jgi:precorrin-3B C17-methyltransferase
MTGKLYLVSVGPGSRELIPPMVEQALAASDVIVAYDLYLTWIQPWISGKDIRTLPLTQERDRAQLALEEARAGKTVALISSGDIGIYAMATLAYEDMREDDTFDVQLIPGITSANACASLLGAPLSHDFATLSLSDLLCPWEWIESRARHIAEAIWPWCFTTCKASSARKACTAFWTSCWNTSGRKPCAASCTMPTAKARPWKSSPWPSCAPASSTCSPRW